MGDRSLSLNGCGSENDDVDDFSFSFNAGASTAEPADEIFSNGEILPMYPVFGRTPLLSDPDPDPNLSDLRSESASSTSSAASAVTDIDQNRCEWAPNRGAWKKSGSTGSGAAPGSAPPKGRKVKDLVEGRRSHSDGKEKLGYLVSGSGLDPGKTSSGKKAEMDLVTAHRLFYGKEKGGEKGGGGKKSFLPYKQELVGLFARGRARHPNPFNL